MAKVKIPTEVFGGEMGMRFRRLSLRLTLILPSSGMLQSIGWLSTQSTLRNIPDNGRIQFWLRSVTCGIAAESSACAFSKANRNLVADKAFLP
jgi:hypothetical protein